MPNKAKVYVIDTNVPQQAEKSIARGHSRQAMHHLTEEQTKKFDPDEVLDVSSRDGMQTLGCIVALIGFAIFVP
jgi:hypothetical protein